MSFTLESLYPKVIWELLADEDSRYVVSEKLLRALLKPGYFSFVKHFFLKGPIVFSKICLWTLASAKAWRWVKMMFTYPYFHYYLQFVATALDLSPCHHFHEDLEGPSYILMNIGDSIIAEGLNADEIRWSDYQKLSQGEPLIPMRQDVLNWFLKNIPEALKRMDLPCHRIFETKALSLLKLVFNAKLLRLEDLAAEIRSADSTFFEYFAEIGLFSDLYMPQIETLLLGAIPKNNLALLWLVDHNFIPVTETFIIKLLENGFASVYRELVPSKFSGFTKTYLEIASNCKSSSSWELLWYTLDLGLVKTESVGRLRDFHWATSSDMVSLLSKGIVEWKPEATEDWAYRGHWDGIARAIKAGLKVSTVAFDEVLNERARFNRFLTSAEGRRKILVNDPCLFEVELAPLCKEYYTEYHVAAAIELELWGFLAWYLTEFNASHSLATNVARSHLSVKITEDARRQKTVFDLIPLSNTLLTVLHDKYKIELDPLINGLVPDAVVDFVTAFSSHLDHLHSLGCKFDKQIEFYLALSKGRSLSNFSCERD